MRYTGRSCSSLFAIPFACLLVFADIEVASSQLAEAATPVTIAQMREQMGAANWIPSDAGLFTAGYRYGEQWQALQASRAYQELLTMPGVQMGLAWFHQQPYLAQLQAARDQNPLIDQAIRVLSDAFGQEVFLYVDQRGPGFVNALSEVYGVFFWNGIKQGWRENQLGGLLPQDELQLRTDMVHQIMALREDLRIPGIVFGFRLSDAQAGRDLIAGIKTLVQQTVPLPVAEESLGGGNYLTLPLDAEMILTPERRSELEDELMGSLVDPVLVNEVMKFLETQTMSISVGMRDDYLLVSVGSDNRHLANLGKNESLANSQALAPVRKHFREKLTGVTYVDAAYTNSGKIEVEQWIASLQDLASSFEDELPAGMSERLLSDVEQLLLEMNDHLPEAQPLVSASFWNQGYESFQFSALAPGSLASGERLKILDHAGPAPLLALAGNSPPFLPQYERLYYWLGLMCGYVEECVDHFVPPEQRKDYEEFEALALPTIRKVHETTRDLLIPSLDGGQSLFAMDGVGALTLSPDDKTPLQQPILFPRPALLFEVNDAGKLIAACTRYRQIFNSLMETIAEQSPNVQQVEWPAPVSRAVGAATLYSYPIPADYPIAEYLNNDFEPHVLLTPKHVVLSLSVKQSLKMLQAKPFHETQVVDLAQPSARVTLFDFSLLTKLIFDDVDAVLTLIGSQQQLDPTTAMMVKVHADKLRNAMSTIRSYRSRTYEEDGRQVTHSWLHLHDLEP